MRVLHVNSDWKWTGPAEPMLLLLQGLAELGHEVSLACPEPQQPDGPGLATEARAAGLAPCLALDGSRRVRFRRDGRDARQLGEIIEARQIDVVHAWHSRGHALAWRAARGWRSKRRCAVVRSLAVAEVPRARPWSRAIFGPGCDGLLCPSPDSAERMAVLRGRRPLLGCLGAVSPQRFAPADGAAFRAAHGIPESTLVIGVVARAQRHRRFDLLFDALRALRDRGTDARMLVLGRGSHFDELVREPVERLGLREHVVLAGYQRGADYARALAAMDVFTFLVPGSDGTCRALLESAAAGIPAVASRRAPLPEIVVDGDTGLLVDESAQALADAWSRLLEDAGLRARLGEAARKRAETLFVPARLAMDVVRLYEEALSSRIHWSESTASSR